MRHISKISALALTLATAAATAQTIRTEKNMSLELANQLASASVVACAVNGYAVTATVVDRAGTVRAVQRADNAWPHTLVRQFQRHVFLGAYGLCVGGCCDRVRARAEILMMWRMVFSILWLANTVQLTVDEL